MKALVFAVLLVQAIAFAGEPSAAYQKRLFGSVENYQLIQTAPTVQIALLLLPKGLTALSRSDPFRLEQGPVVSVPADLQQLIRTVLADEKLDDPEVYKACEPQYGVRLLFSDGTKHIAINLCLGCAILATSNDVEIVGSGNFDPALKKIIAIVKKLFPKDAAIQQLED